MIRKYLFLSECYYRRIQYIVTASAGCDMTCVGIDMTCVGNDMNCVGNDMNCAGEGDIDLEIMILEGW